jgi:hypothetical protein
MKHFVFVAVQQLTVALTLRKIVHFDFLTQKQRIINIYEVEPAPNTRLTGHRCADYFFMKVRTPLPHARARACVQFAM